MIELLSLKIGKQCLGDFQVTKVIAEVGINHNGNFDLALKHCNLATASGADFVKLHLAYAKNMINLDSKRSAWSDKHDKNEDPIDQFVSRMELSREEYIELKSVVESSGAKLMMSVYDMEAAEDALSMGIQDIKLASCDFTKVDMIKYLTQYVDHLYLATGMVTEDELSDAKSYINPEKTTVMHCISRYPTPYEDLNISFINTLRSYGWRVGYSDHTKGIGSCAISLQYSPEIIEKHFVIADTHLCPDLAVSCTPREMTELCALAHNIDSVLGDGSRQMTSEEFTNRAKFRDRWS